MALTAKQRQALLEKGRSVNLSPNDPKFQRPKKHDPHKVFSKVAPQEEQPPADRRTVAPPADHLSEIPLAPVQWRVWEAICRAETEGKIVSRRELASLAKATIRGVRDAMKVLEEAGGILSKRTVRSASEQGIQFTLDHSISFRQASRKETLGILKKTEHTATGRRSV